MTVRVRIAPSPTGYPHIGTARQAVANWLFAKKAGGEFMLRIDDTDVERSRPECAQAIEDDLRWLGLSWDIFARQSERMARYHEEAEKLKASGRIYPCYETEEELELSRRSQLAAGRPPAYNRTALKLPAAERAKLEAAGRKPHWRFLLGDDGAAWHDLVAGEIRFAPGHVSDPVIIREDGTFLYSFCSVVDDADFAITHVIRGADHTTNTAAQIEMWKAIGAKVPEFAHLPLLVDADGGKLSKRLDSLSLRALREEHGIEALALMAFLARLGSSDAIAPAASVQELIDGFDFSKLSNASQRFDLDELKHLSAKTLHAMPFEAARDRLSPQATEAFWLAVRGNLSRMDEAAVWMQVVAGDIIPVREDEDFLKASAKLLPPEPWDNTTWKAWTTAVATATGRKGKPLYHPLRLALTAHETGPEMAALLPLIGRKRFMERLTSCPA